MSTAIIPLGQPQLAQKQLDRAALVVESREIDNDTAVELVFLQDISDALVNALLTIAKAYIDDPGTSDLDDDQPVRIYLGDVRRAWSALRQAGVEWK